MLPVSYQQLVCPGIRLIRRMRTGRSKPPHKSRRSAVMRLKQ